MTAPVRDAILTALRRAPGQFVPAKDIIAAVWGDPQPKAALSPHYETLRVLIRRLRAAGHHIDAGYHQGCGPGYRLIEARCAA